MSLASTQSAIPWPPTTGEQGTIVRPDGVQFVLFARHADSVMLLLFDDPQAQAAKEIVLDPQRYRFGDLWSVLVPDARPGQCYAYRIDGPYDPDAGHHYDPQCILIDPWSKATTSSSVAIEAPYSLVRSVVVDDAFDWQGVGRPRIHLADSIIYELHVRGFTNDPVADIKNAGTYLGLIEKIDYLKELGVTTVELLPVHEFDRNEKWGQNPVDQSSLSNYWGYSTIGFFAPNGRYATLGGSAVVEFKTMVRELHRAGIEVILDVVFNHTAEGNHAGPVVHFKGIDNSIYYHLSEDNRRFYRDYTGCGNSVNCNHPVVRQLIIHSLRYWATHMGVDGFRFDLASVLCRDRAGRLHPNPPLIEAIAEDPILRDVKLIAEAWDAAGAYQVGAFPGGDRWSEWNGRYRDDVRQFWRGDPGKTGLLATRITGSSDLYEPTDRGPHASVNFVTCHDGFTLNDLVSYNAKHNLGNGEENRDGGNDNYSYNFGTEGPTHDPGVDRLRRRQVKNFLATLLVSQGTPMLLAGDEFLRTQLGNNNAYCQDNSISWLDWSLLRTHHEIFRFTKALIAFRKRHVVLRRREFFRGQGRSGRGIADVNWYDAQGKPKDWGRDEHTLVCLIDGTLTSGKEAPIDHDVLLLINGSFRTVQFYVPAGGASDRHWRVFFDTGNTPPNDVYPNEAGPIIHAAARYPLVERSIACLHRPAKTGG